MKWEQLNQMGMQLYQQGNFPRAIQIFEEALNEARKNLGPDHPYYAGSLHNLASMYQAMGEYAEAEPLYLESIEISERELGPDHPYYASNLALMYQDYASSLNNLALMYRDMGKYAEAEPLCRKSMEIRKRELGPDHPDYATSLNNLALLYQDMGEYAQAEPLYRESMEICKRVLGPNHPHYAFSLASLTTWYAAMGEYKKAEPLCLESIEICKRVLGTNHSRYATSLNILALLYQGMGKYAEAEPLCRESMETYKRVLGPDHPHYATSLNNLACLEIRLGSKSSALENMLQSAQIHNKMILRMLAIGDENRLARYIDTFDFPYFALLSLFCQSDAELKSHTPEVCTLILQRKSLHRELIAMKRDSLLASQRPELQKQFTELRRLNLTIAQRLMAGPQKMAPADYQKKLKELESRKETLEKELAKEVPELELRQKLAAVSDQTVAKLLPLNSALVEYVCFREVDFQTMRYRPLKYIALIIKQDHPEPEMVELGNGAEIESLVALYRKQIIASNAKPGTSKETQESAQAGLDVAKKLSSQIVEAVVEKLNGIRRLILSLVALYRKQIIASNAKKLSSQIVGAVVEKLNGIRRLILSPDGALCLLPFEVLRQPNGRYLVEDYEISYVDSGKDLLRWSYRPKSKGQPTILAHPDFDLAGSGNPVESLSSIAGRRDVEVEKQIARGDPPVSFRPLPNTETEGRILHELFSKNCRFFTREAVLDATVKKIQSPAILHLATHGFFFPDPEVEEKEEPLLQLMCFLFGEEPMFKGRRFKNPLLRSGLALAGANTFMQGKEPAPGAEDGLLMALDITGMDLVGTDLVVLSACETGLGEVKIGQGVYGLRHSFILAGARTLVLSLWKVPDAETKELMVRFYRKVLSGAEKAVALRQAQREMIAKLRAAGQEPAPYKWGAFVCVGDPGKMLNFLVAPTLDSATVGLGYFAQGDTLYQYLLALEEGQVRWFQPATALPTSLSQVEELTKRFDQILPDCPSAEETDEEVTWKYNELNCLMKLYKSLAVEKALEIIRTTGRDLAQTSLCISPEGVLQPIPWVALFDGRQGLQEKVHDLQITPAGLRSLLVQEIHLQEPNQAN